MINYSYKIYKNDYSLEKANWTEFNMTDDYFLGWSTANLTISCLMFQKYSSVFYWKIEMTVLTTTDSVIKSGKSELILKINQVPFNGTCDIDQLNGLALETSFTIICSNWIDEDGYIINYEFYGKIYSQILKISQS